MFFVLSKTLTYLVMPLTLICICLLASVVIRNVRWKKRMLWSGLVMLLFFSNDFIANECMRAWELPPTPISDLQPYELGIVLTGSTLSLSPNDRVYFQRGADRVTHTVQLYKAGLLEKILISGGSGRLTGEPEPEANLFKKAMVMMGVPDSAIIIENETRNTYESAVQVKQMLEDQGYKGADCLLITSAFHMRRSLACYRKAGVQLDHFTTDFYSHSREFYPDTLIIPQLNALIVWHKLVREWVGFLAYKLAGYI
ncbi:YdcF family protein [Fulvivirgaceae bacterium PWU4]|uniref:YdcF family protein n=1 Tax=Chryseosolibacter histidini TaxID=2782349 RepID=A0AAP2GMK3_9BACT|nr:YdcF family protein [Chryseosolibacter histidini]MBT1695770.1 YdcF family protein [Chryseosolibacter histidini]